MKTKKSPKADLESRKGLFLEIGFIVALACCLAAFNVRSYDNKVKDLVKWDNLDPFEVLIPPTASDELPPPPPPAESAISTDFDIVEDDVEPINEATVFDAGAEAVNAMDMIRTVEVPVEDFADEDLVIVMPEEDPEFPGGLEALYKFIGANLRYPSVAKEGNIEGRVYVGFVVERDGSVSNVVVKRDCGGGCGAEAVRVVKAMPKWNPGKMNGRPVRTSFTLPVMFELN